MRQTGPFPDRPSRRGLHLGAMLVAASAALAAMPAGAQSLDALRAGGLVAERYDGLAVARSNDPATLRLVEEVNAERRKIYARQAAAQGVPVDQVGRVFASQIFAKAPPGTHFVQENGETIRK